jgi:hypothetical protein
MGMAGAGTGHTSINTKIYLFPTHTAVHEGIAVFFCSTHFRLKPVHNPKYHIILKKSASALKGCAFSLSEKVCFWHFAMPVRRPSGSETVEPNFRTGGNQSEN